MNRDDFELGTAEEILAAVWPDLAHRVGYSEAIVSCRAAFPKDLDFPPELHEIFLALMIASFIRGASWMQEKRTH